MNEETAEENKRKQLINEYKGNTWVDITHKDWEKVMDHFIELGKNLKALKVPKAKKGSDHKEPPIYNLPVMRTIFLVNK